MELLGLINIPNWFLVTCIIFVLIYTYLTWNYGYWEKQHVTTVKPSVILGNLLMTLKQTVAENDVKNMKEYGRVYGLYEVRNPYLMVNDLDLVKIILIKDFNYFEDRRIFPLGGKAKITRQFLTNLQGDEWRSARSILTPTFTSGKLRQMASLMEGSAKKMIKSCQNDIKKQNGIVNIKDRFGVFTMDVIASCCFSYDIDTQDPNDPFIQHAKLLFNRNFAFVMILMVLIPKLVKILELSVFPEECLTFFEKAVKKVVAIRRKENLRRNDFLQLLLDAQELESKGKLLEETDNRTNGKNEEYDPNAWKKNKVLDESGLVANSILFLLAGFDTTATTISFTAYCLALNPDCQSQLHEEIDQTLQQHGKLTHEIVKNMSYLDKVISETLRKYPVAVRLERTCTRDYQLGDISIQKGMLVSCGVYAIHHDPEIYPNPEVFDPERFSPENKAQRHPMAYLPFGTGPRVCIGMRFALMEAKLALAHFFSEFKVSPCSKTEIPLKMRKGIPMLIPINGVTLKVENRH